MAKAPRPIGEILVELGFITPDDVAQALARQRERGGKLGDALVEMGAVTRSEVEWGLADQYDLPMVQLQPESIDRAVAERVPRAWARANLMLPVLRSGDTVTAVLCDPRDVERLHEIARFTGAVRVEAALTSAENLRALIDTVYPAAEAVALGDWFEEAAGREVRELGISVRGSDARGWTGDDAAARQPFAAGWPLELARLLTPAAPRTERGRGVVRWSALADFGGERWITDCRRIAAEGAAEWTVHLVHQVPGGSAGVAAEPLLVAAIGEARAQGTVTVAVDAEVAPPVRAVLLTELPAATLGAHCRAVHLTAAPTPLPRETLTLSPTDLGSDGRPQLQPFRWDALTLADPEEETLGAALGIAPVVFFPAGVGRATLRVRLSGSPAQPVWTLAEEDRGSD